MTVSAQNNSKNNECQLTFSAWVNRYLFIGYIICADVICHTGKIRNSVLKDVPCVLGESGAVDKGNNSERAKQAYTYVKLATQYKMPTFIWYGLMDKADRATLTWTSPEIKDSIFRAIEDAISGPYSTSGEE